MGHRHQSPPRWREREDEEEDGGRVTAEQMALSEKRAGGEKNIYEARLPKYYALVKSRASARVSAHSL